MTLKQWLIKKIRAAVGTQEIINVMKEQAAYVVSFLGESQETKPRTVASGLHLLPGNPYQKFLLPLEYLPSRDYRPRWGYSRPPHPVLSGLFAKNQAAYVKIIDEIRSLEPFLLGINSEFSHERAPEPGWLGGPINALDLALLYYFVYKYRPGTYLEIGSGLTTCFARRAIRDHELKTRVISIDPEPRTNIHGICDEVIQEGLETVGNLKHFESLRSGDIVFVDGSHRSFMNSDVTVFMVDVLPFLKPGVVVHFHDIFLPYDYPDLFKNWYWNEQYLLAVYLLAGRERIQVLMPSFFLSVTPDLRECLRPPILRLGREEDSWLNGGSLWFTHTE